MKFEKSKHYKRLKPYKLKHTTGDYYFCENFFISEIREGEHFSWEKVELIVKETLKFYGDKNRRIGFISNRVNSYSLDPQNWLKIQKMYNLVSCAIVVYRYSTLLSATLEKEFVLRNYKDFISLDEAIEWTESIEELKTSN